MTTSRSRNELAGERVLVVGGRGFVGSHVVRALIATGARPQLFGPAMAEDRLSDLAGAFDEHEASLESRDRLREVLAASQARFVVSCAAHGAGKLGLMRSGEAEADATLAVNVLGHRNLLEAAREAGVARVIWMSSTVVYGPAEPGPRGREVLGVGWCSSRAGGGGGRGGRRVLGLPGSFRLMEGGGGGGWAWSLEEQGGGREMEGVAVGARSPRQGVFFFSGRGREGGGCRSRVWCGCEEREEGGGGRRGRAGEERVAHFSGGILWVGREGEGGGGGGGG